MILLDTHTLIYTVVEPRRLSRAAASAIRRAQAGEGLGISAISLWELAMIFAHGHVRAYGTVEDSVRLMVDSARVSVKPITAEIASLAVQFPDDYPRDPADRLIGATARAEGVALVTRDEGIRSSPLLKTIW
ncbi:MAG TPA: type II toxin-antitoxin system VapC family toxin [Terriglobia bacterium]|nr:type II toxin-antitoxin system VapC family toxin [Terriglobia bacterium]